MIQPSMQAGQKQQLDPQLTAQVKVYKKTNAYTHTASFQQILTIFLFTTQFAIHCVFIIRPVFGIDHGLLYFLWALLILSISCVVFDYFLLTCQDPADRLLVQPDGVSQWKVRQLRYQKRGNQQNCKSEQRQFGQPQNKNPYKVKHCKACRQTVKQSSYHCWTCNRCVQNMDHHCKYLNNCIGQRNYSSFFRLLCCVSVYLFISIAVGIWVFVAGFYRAIVDQLAFSKWLGLIFAVFSLGLLVVVQTLLWFHCYISCCLKMTTIQYLFRDTPSNAGTSSAVDHTSQKIEAKN